MRPPAPALLIALCAAGSLSACAGEPDTPADVRVQAGSQDVTAQPTQYCLDGEGQRYDVTPPIVEVSPGTDIRLTVPERIAERGWQVQVFDDELQEVIGEVDVPDGTETFAVGSSDVVPPAFYLVVVEDAGGECGEFTAAWPVGFLRAGG